MKKLLATLALSAACASASATGSFMNTHTLLMNLNHMDLTMLSYGYIMGVADAEDGNLFCIPNGIGGTDLAAHVVNFHQSKAGSMDHLQQSARFFIKQALVRSFPCKR